MLQALFDSTSIPVLEQMVGFAEARHAVLAGNIANLDTPGYRVRDLSPEVFQGRLKQAIQARREEHASLTDSPLRDADDEMTAVRESTRSILYHDDSYKNLEHQVTEISKNQMQHNMAIAIMRSQFDMLHAAIREQA